MPVFRLSAGRNCCHEPHFQLINCIKSNRAGLQRFSPLAVPVRMHRFIRYMFIPPPQWTGRLCYGFGRTLEARCQGGVHARTAGRRSAQAHDVRRARRHSPGADLARMGRQCFAQDLDLSGNVSWLPAHELSHRGHHRGEQIKECGCAWTD